MDDRGDLETLFIDHLPQIERIVAVVGRCQGLRNDDLSDFRSAAMLRLVADDYAVLRRFRGESSLATYLTVVLTMAAREYRVARWGRWRPSAAARALGPLAIRLESLVHRDGYSLHEASRRLRTAGETELGDSELAAILARLPMRTNSRRRASSEPWSSGVDAHTVPGADLADDMVLQAERDVERERIGASLAAAMATLQAEERVLLRLRYWQGLTVADAARALSVPQKPLYRRLERAMTRLRAALERAGVAAHDVQRLCVESLPMPAPEGEEWPGRPSMVEGPHEELSQ